MDVLTAEEIQAESDFDARAQANLAYRNLERFEILALDGSDSDVPS